MPGWNDLTPDERAALELVAGRKRTYAEVARALGTSEEVARARVLAGAEALSPPPAALPREEAAAVVDHVLGAAPGDARTLSVPAQRWARRLRTALAPPAPPAERAPRRAPRRPRLPRPGHLPAGRGGLLVGAGVCTAGLLALVLVLLLSGGEGDGERARASGTTTPRTTATQPSGQPEVRSQSNLTAPGGGAAKAVVQLLTQGEAAGFQITAQGVAERPGSYVALWAQGGSTATEVAAIENGKIAGGRINGLARVPANLNRYETLLLTREPSAGRRRPARPSGDVLARGALEVPGDFRR
jgi:Sigma-70, region 4